VYSTSTSCSAIILSNFIYMKDCYLLSATQKISTRKFNLTVFHFLLSVSLSGFYFYIFGEQHNLWKIMYIIVNVTMTLAVVLMCICCVAIKKKNIEFSWAFLKVIGMLGNYLIYTHKRTFTQGFHNIQFICNNFLLRHGY
jgi:hypothetical protein